MKSEISKLSKLVSELENIMSREIDETRNKYSQQVMELMENCDKDINTITHYYQAEINKVKDELKRLKNNKCKSCKGVGYIGIIFRKGTKLTKCRDCEGTGIVKADH